MYTFGIMILWKCPSFSLAKNKSGIQTLAASVRVRYLILPVPQNITIIHISDGSFQEILFLAVKKGNKVRRVSSTDHLLFSVLRSVQTETRSESHLYSTTDSKWGDKTKQITGYCRLTYREKPRSVKSKR